MNIQVIYATMTGHSRKLATAAAQALGVTAKNIKDTPEIRNADLLLIVSGIYSGKPQPQLIEFLKTLDRNAAKKAVLITSSVGGAANAEAREALQAQGIPVEKEEFQCKGSFLFMGLPHPTKADLAAAGEFAARAAKK